MNATDLDPAALLAALHAALDADPSDAATRRMLADFLEDAGDPVAARGQRWQALRGRWPERAPVWLGIPHACRAWHAPRSRVIRWAYPGSHVARKPLAWAVLPGDDLFRLLRAGLLPGDQPCWQAYPSRRAAEDDLAQALEALAVREAVLAGYEPDPCPWCGERRQVRSGAEHACDPDGGCGRRWTA